MAETTEKSGPATHVLIQCEDPAKKDLFRSLFDISGLNAEVAEDEEDFWGKLAAGRVDVILLAASLPEPRAYEQCVALDEPGSDYRDIPVVIVYPEDTPKEMALHGLHLGAYDFLIEPFNEIELLTKVTVLAKIKHAEDEFRQLAIRDKLTGLYDKRYLYIRFSEELSRAKRYSKPISCIYLGVDGMSGVNEKYGNEAGDVLLQVIADTLTGLKREVDVLARYEDDGFVMALYNTDAPGVRVLADRLLEGIREASCPFDKEYQPSVSLGMASIDTNPELTMHSQELLQRAELALKRAKQEGGNQAVTYTDSMAADLMPDQA